MSVRATIEYWKSAGITPDEALAGFGFYVGHAATWTEVAMVAETAERRLAEEAASAEREVRPRPKLRRVG